MATIAERWAQGRVPMDDIAFSAWSGERDRAGVATAMAVKVFKLYLGAVGVLKMQMLPAARDNYVTGTLRLARVIFQVGFLDSVVLPLANLDPVFLPGTECLAGRVSEN
jgi:hypothetical protein